MKIFKMWVMLVYSECQNEHNIMPTFPEDDSGARKTFSFQNNRLETRLHRPQATDYMEWAKPQVLSDPKEALPYNVSVPFIYSVSDEAWNLKQNYSAHDWFSWQKLKHSWKLQSTSKQWCTGADSARRWSYARRSCVAALYLQWDAVCIKKTPYQPK